ncbi:unnamed protein product, partial [Porites evermanni]
IGEVSGKFLKCKENMSACICAICKHFTSVDKKPYHCEKCGICRTNRDRLSVSLERHAQNPGYQRFRGQQLQRSGMENPGDGLADWFVIKHTRDDALSRELLSKYGFKAADTTQNDSHPIGLRSSK